jgi:predicted Rossmann fold nucleotide-binding protein DprA/Smf involved in DNA uptake
MENRVENAQMTNITINVVKDVHVLMYNGKLYMEIIANTVNTFYLPSSRVSKRQFVRRNKTALEPGDRLRLPSKLRI